jgi:hypothetical protein
VVSQVIHNQTHFHFKIESARESQAVISRFSEVGLGIDGDFESWGDKIIRRWEGVNASLTETFYLEQDGTLNFTMR